MSAVSAKLKRNEIMWRDSILCRPPGGRSIAVITISHCYRYFFEIKCDTAWSADTCAIAALTNGAFQKSHLGLRCATTTQACTTERDRSRGKNPPAAPEQDHLPQMLLHSELSKVKAKKDKPKSRLIRQVSPLALLA